uniref:Uncharacterized protein n=1 Tax=Desulfovibrio desulfuricans (strain ATCC 27774 / DSM 6949 / MB) TaxID=525146 RepID=B8J301_DESDA
MATAQGQQLFKLAHVWYWLPPGAAFFHKLIEVDGDAAIVVAGMVERFGIGLVKAQAGRDLDGDVFVNVPKLLDQRVVIGQALFTRQGAAKQATGSALKTWMPLWLTAITFYTLPDDLKFGKNLHSLP